MIPKIIHQIWIGNLEPPLKWMNTWKEKNPNWEYRVWGNDELYNTKWRNKKLINEYLKRYKRDVYRKGARKDVFVTASGTVFKGEKATLFAWHVIADLMRYEILYEYGGYMPGSDSECLKSIDDKFTTDFDCYTVRTGNLYTEEHQALKEQIGNSEPTEQQLRMLNRYDPHNASPILACKKHSPFVKQIIEELHKIKPHELGEAVDTTGNVFMGKMIKKYQPKDLYMIDYVVGKDRIKTDQYSIHYAGTTLNAYAKGR